MEVNLEEIKKAQRRIRARVAFGKFVQSKVLNGDEYRRNCKDLDQIYNLCKKRGVPDDPAAELFFKNLTNDGKDLAGDLNYALFGTYGDVIAKIIIKCFPDGGELWMAP